MLTIENTIIRNVVTIRDYIDGGVCVVGFPPLF
jgi:hypothetical protein